MAFTSFLAATAILQLAITSASPVPPALLDCPEKRKGIRFLGGTNEFSGFVQVYTPELDEWGYVCDDNFDEDEAKVACRQLGFTGVEENDPDSDDPTAFSPTTVGLKNECTGSEPSIQDCGLVPDSCSRGVAGIACEGLHAGLPLKAGARLVDAEHGDWRRKWGGTVGRLQVQVDGTWTEVCYDDFSDGGASEAEVVCRQLGLTGGLAYAFYGVKLSIAMDSFSCVGDEQRLQDCHLREVIFEHNCGADELAAVRCKATSLSIQTKSEADLPPDLAGAPAGVAESTWSLKGPGFRTALLLSPLAAAVPVFLARRMRAARGAPIDDDAALLVEVAA